MKRVKLRLEATSPCSHRTALSKRSVSSATINNVSANLNSRASYKRPLLVAPFGAEKIEQLRSIFEVPHVRENGVFLDTQCNSILFNLMFCW